MKMHISDRRKNELKHLGKVNGGINHNNQYRIGHTIQVSQLHIQQHPTRISSFHFLSVFMLLLRQFHTRN